MHGHLSSCSPCVCWKTIVKALLEHSPGAQVGPHRCSVSLVLVLPGSYFIICDFSECLFSLMQFFIPAPCFLVGLKPSLYCFPSWTSLSHSVVSLMRGVDNGDFAVCAFWVLDDMSVLGQIFCPLVFLYSSSYPMSIYFIGFCVPYFISDGETQLFSHFYNSEETSHEEHIKQFTLRQTMVYS